MDKILQIYPLSQQQKSQMVPHPKDNNIKKAQFQYYSSRIRTHMQKIREEVVNIRRATSVYKANAMNLLAFRRTAKECAAMYVQLEDELSTYNAVLELHSSSKYFDKVAFQSSFLKDKNKVSLNKLDILVGYKIKREDKIATLNKALAIEDQTTLTGISNFSQSQKATYLEALNKIERQQLEMNNLHTELNLAKNKVTKLQQSSESKKLRKAELLKERAKALVERNSCICEGEVVVQRSKLLLEMKDAQTDLSFLEKVMISLRGEIREKTARLLEVGAKDDVTNDARVKKHEDLRNRDEFIKEFIVSFPEKSDKLLEHIEKARTRIIARLNVLAMKSIKESKELDEFQEIIDEVPQREIRLYWLQISKTLYREAVASTKHAMSSLQSEMHAIKDVKQQMTLIENELDSANEKQNVLQQTFETVVSLVNKAERRQSELDCQLYGNDMYIEICKVDTDIDVAETENQRLRSELAVVPFSNILVEKLAIIDRTVLDRNNNLLVALQNKNMVSDTKR